AAVALNDEAPVPAPRPARAPELTREKHVANIKSQIKRVRTNRERTERNKAHKSELRTGIRRFRAAAASGDKAAAEEALRSASVKLDKAVSKGVIHKNQAANKKSAMAKRAAQL